MVVCFVLIRMVSKDILRVLLSSDISGVAYFFSRGDVFSQSMTDVGTLED